MNQNTERLRRELGLGGAILMGLGSMVGTGVFVSIGVAAGPDPPDELVAAADAALYDAKRDGRGTWRLAQPRPVD